jgi:outer membrane lipoprotein carrier protein
MKARGSMINAIFTLWLSTLTVAAQAGATDTLIRFFSTVNTISAKFEQVISNKTLNTRHKSSGTLWIERPDKFRWS